MNSEGEVKEPVTGVDAQGGVELSDPTSKEPAGPPQEVCQSRQECEVETNLLFSRCHYSLQATHPLGSKSYTIVQIYIIEILLQHYVEAL